MQSVLRRSSDYDQAYVSSFHEILISIQYNACLAIIGAMKGTSREENYR